MTNPSYAIAQAEVAVHALERAAVPAVPDCRCQVGGVDACSVDSDWLEHVARRIATGWAVLQGNIAQAERERDEALKAGKDAKRLRKQVKAVRELLENESPMGEDLAARDVWTALSAGQKKTHAVG